MPNDTSKLSISRRDLLLTTAAATLTASIAAPSIAVAQNSSPFDLSRFIDDCRSVAHGSDGQAAVEDLLKRAMSNPGDVMAAVGEPEKAGIQTLYRSDNLTVLNIVWAPLMQLMPHEHKMWAALGIYTGREDNILWGREQDTVSANGAVSLSEGDVATLPDDVIHSVANPIQKLTGAIHVYGNDFFDVPRSEWDPESLDEYAWDIEKARKLFQDSNDRFKAWQSTPQCI